jgi:hypothetical protein
MVRLCTVQNARPTNMQDALTGTYPIRKPRAAALHALETPRSELSFVQALQATFGVFARHPVPVLACAVVCFAGAGIIGSLVYGAIIGEAVLRTGTHTGSPMRAFNTQMLVQAMIGTFAALLGRGAISWITLQDHAGGPVTLRMALRETLRRWQPLLLSTLIYGAIITLGLAGLMALLRELRLDASNVRSARGDMNNVLNWTVTRAIAVLPPDAGSPFNEWFSTMRYSLARAAGSTYFGFDLSGYPTPAVTSQVVLVGAASMALLFVADVLLCMRTAACFAAQGAFGWLRASLAAGGAHFWRVAAWRWAVRLVLALITIGALVLIPALHQNLVMNEVRRMLGTGYWPYHIAQSANGIGIALVSGILLAFSVAFEARLFATLMPATPAREA